MMKERRFVLPGPDAPAMIVEREADCITVTIERTSVYMTHGEARTLANSLLCWLDGSEVEDDGDITIHGET